MLPVVLYPFSVAICVVKDVEPLNFVSPPAVKFPLVSTKNFSTGLTILLYIINEPPIVLIEFVPIISVPVNVVADIVDELINPLYPFTDVHDPINVCAEFAVVCAAVAVVCAAVAAVCAPFAVKFATVAVVSAESAAVCAVFAAVDNVASCVVNDVLDDPYNKSFA